MKYLDYLNDSKITEYIQRLCHKKNIFDENDIAIITEKSINRLVEKYDESRGTTPKTYVVYLTRTEIKNFIQKRSRRRTILNTIRIVDKPTKLINDVRDSLDALSTLEKDILLYRYMYNYSKEEICDKLEINTIKYSKLLRKARKNFKKVYNS